MFTYPYAKPSVTATVFAFYNDMLVVGVRSKWAEAFPDSKCVPGGFLEAHYESNGVVLNEGETVEETAIREFEEECGITLDGDQLILFHENSHPKTDPRCHVVNLCYIANLTAAQVEMLQAGDDIASINLVPCGDILEDLGTNNDWAFNHLILAHMAILVWRSGGDYFQGKGIWSP